MPGLQHPAGPHFPLPRDSKTCLGHLLHTQRTLPGASCRIFSFTEVFHPWVSPLQEAYSVARQFNMIPPVCEQAEYHLFQREKVEVQLPELYHKIGESEPAVPSGSGIPRKEWTAG